MTFKLKSAIFLLLLLFCMSAEAQVQKGKASYYSRRATGARTASGERLHHDSLTCAHRYYPFGTILRVTNLANGKQVDVRVTDRGPYGRGRIIDLSYAAAEQLGMLATGVTMVEVEVIQQGDVIFPLKQQEELNLPDIDFEAATSGYSYINKWTNEDEEANESTATERIRKAENRRPTIKRAAHTNTAGIAGQKTTNNKKHQQANKQQPSTTQQKKQPKDTWKRVFDKVKSWFE